MRVTFKWNGNLITADIFALIFNQERGHLLIDIGDGTGFICNNIRDPRAERLIRDLQVYGYADLSELEFEWTDKLILPEAE